MDLPLRNWEQYPAKAFVDTSWTNNNYGAVKIPHDHFFIMGDSRENSEDFKIKGLVPKKGYQSSSVELITPAPSFSTIPSQWKNAQQNLARFLH